ncbi:MAG: ComEC/Rec2 family competence protein [Acidobacteriota bacterium]|nr:ComEC/Rec2 family competence protein [Acidobacteriota bacterium]
MRIATAETSFNPYPLALLAAAFASGVLVAVQLHLEFRTCAACAAIVAILAACAAFRRFDYRQTSWLIVAAFAGAGATLALIDQNLINENSVRRFYESGQIAAGEPVEATGILAGAPELAPDGIYFTLMVEHLRFKSREHVARGTIELFAPVRERETGVEYDALTLKRGARVRVMTALSREEKFRNPGGSSLTEYLDRRGVDATGIIKSPLLVEHLSDEAVFPPLAWLDKWRGQLLARINQLFSVDTAGVLNASMLGNRYGLSRATAERFRLGGTFHVLVISGLHITFIGGVVWALARRVTKRRAWQWLLSTVVVWAYATAVGAEPSVVRAAFMFTLVALAPVLHRQGGTLNALGGAALVLLVGRPRELFDPSFQLTFLSVLAIVALAWPLLTRLREVGEWRPTHATPYPPECPRWWRVLGESLFWNERQWRREMARGAYSYRLFKSPLAAWARVTGLQIIARYAFAAMLVSLCVQLGLLPLLIIYFHRLSLASVFLNVFVGALIAALSFCALLALSLTSFEGVVVAPLLWLTEKINWLMVHSVDPFADADWAQWRVPEYSGRAAVIYMLYFVPLVVLAVALARWHPVRRGLFAVTEGKGSDANGTNIRRAKIDGARIYPVAAVLYLLLLAVVVAHPWSAARPDGKLRVDFLDVGQGDAALVTMPDGTTLLVDGGGRPRFTERRRTTAENAADSSDGNEHSVENDGANASVNADDVEHSTEPFERDARGIGEAVVSEYLWWRGLDRVDYVLATHADADHIDGLNDVLSNFNVRVALVGRVPANDAEYERFVQTLRRRSVPVHVINRGDVLRFGAVVGEVLWPPGMIGNDPASSSSRNDDSVVLRLRFGNRTLLLTGDIEKRAEGALLAAGEDLRRDVLKVAHHGSLTSSTQAFANAAPPALAVISVGRDSPYGHPHAEVVERWRAGGARVLTTGDYGTISIIIDGDAIYVETYVQE